MLLDPHWHRVYQKNNTFVGSGGSLYAGGLQTVSEQDMKPWLLSYVYDFHMLKY